MRILQLCKKFPYPLNDGESIAVTFLAKALRDLGHEVTLLSMNTKKHFFDLEQLPAEFDHYERIETSYLDNSVNYLNIFSNLFTTKSFHVYRFITEDFRQKLIGLLTQGDYDLVLLETIILAPYIEVIRGHSKALVAMRAHNVEHEIWAHIAANSKSLPKKIVLNQASSRLKKFELSVMNKVDLFVAIAESDLVKFRAFGLKKQSVVVPIGLDEKLYIPDYQSFRRSLSLSFIGSLDWMPNVEGLNWFLETAWPAVHRAFGDLTFHVAGKKTPTSLLNLRIPNVTFYGEVPDAPAFINEHSVMIVPLLSGSGIRAKIIEGMMLGKVVITTRLGLEGIFATHQENILIADTPDEFVDAIRFCHSHPEKLIKIGQSARTFALKHFSNLAIGQVLVDGVEDAVGAVAG